MVFFRSFLYMKEKKKTFFCNNFGIRAVIIYFCFVNRFPNMSNEDKEKHNS